MKIILVGLWAWPQYEAAVADGLRENGAEVSAVKLGGIFAGRWGSAQLALPVPLGALRQVNRKILAAVQLERPDWVFFWRPTHVLPSTLQKLASMGFRTVSYNNDDPFGPKVHDLAPWHHHFLWHWYLKCLKHFDKNYFFRRINCSEAKVYGAKHADVLLPYFNPELDRPLQLTEADRARYGCEIVFAGHYEDDGRVEMIRRLVSAGLKVKLWGGPSWSHAALGDLYEQFGPVEPVLGDDYRKALCGADICLCLMSRMNRDTYTTRCFEIPACGQVMLAERTDELVAMFKEDEEACFFSSPDELASKARWLLDNTARRQRIAAAGQRRVWADGHAVVDRCRGLLQALEPAA